MIDLKYDRDNIETRLKADTTQLKGTVMGYTGLKGKKWKIFHLILFFFDIIKYNKMYELKN